LDFFSAFEVTLILEWRDHLIDIRPLKLTSCIVLAGHHNVKNTNPRAQNNTNSELWAALYKPESNDLSKKICTKSEDLLSIPARTMHAQRRPMLSVLIYNYAYSDPCFHFPSQMQTNYIIQLTPVRYLCTPLIAAKVFDTRTACSHSARLSTQA